MLISLITSYTNLIKFLPNSELCSMFNNKANFLGLVILNQMNLTRIVSIEQAPKGEFKRLTRGVIDFDKGITILFNQCLASKPFNSH